MDSHRLTVNPDELICNWRVKKKVLHAFKEFMPAVGRINYCLPRLCNFSTRTIKSKCDVTYHFTSTIIDSKGFHQSSSLFSFDLLRVVHEFRWVCVAIASVNQAC